jgi:hypothetical protein
MDIEKIKSIERLFYNKQIKIDHDLNTCHLQGESEKYLRGQLSIINELLGHLKAAATENLPEKPGDEKTEPVTVYYKCKERCQFHK